MLTKLIKFCKKHFILSPTLLIISIPLLIHILFKWNSHIYWIEAEWSAGDILSYLGTLLAAFIAIIGVYFTIKENNENNKENTRLEKLPFLLLKSLEFKSNFTKPTYTIAPENSSLSDMFPSGSFYKEFSLTHVYFIIIEKHVHMYDSLTPKQRNIIEHKGFILESLNKPYKNCKLSYCPLQITNVGTGAIINLRIGLNNVLEKKYLYTTPLALDVHDTIYLAIYAENNPNDNIGEYELDLIYEDIYQNKYKQTFKCEISSKDNLFPLTIDFTSTQELLSFDCH